MGQLIEKISSLENLRTAATIVKSANPFLRDRDWLVKDLDFKLEALGQDLVSGSFKPENLSYFFSIGDKRLICATMNVRSVVAVSAICEVLREVFRVGEVETCTYSVDEIDGILRCCRQWKKSTKWALCTDIEKFFGSVDHKLLIGAINNEINCKITIGVLRNLLKTFDEAGARLSSESTYFQYRQGFGLPAGIELVYVLANAFLKSTDQVVSVAAQSRVARYIDDYLCFGSEEDEMHSIFTKLDGSLGQLGLKLNKTKTFIQPCNYPISFLRQQI